MKKVFLLLFTVLSLVAFSQQSEVVKRIEITSGAPGSVGDINVLGDVSFVDIYGTATLSTNWTIQAYGTPNYEMSLWAYYHADVNLNGNSLTIFGEELTREMANDTLMIISYYVNSSWETIILQSVNNEGWVISSYIDTAMFNTDEIALSAGKYGLVDNGISIGKIEEMLAGTLIVGDGSNQPTETVVTGDVTINGSGVTAIGNDKVTTVKILDANVTLAKLESLSRGYMIIGNSSNRPTATDVNNNGYLLVGDGTDLNSVNPSGDVDIDGSGNMVIQSLSVETSMIADANVTLAKLEPLTSAQIIVGNVSNRPVARTVTGDIAISNTGVTSISSGVVVNADMADGAITYDKTSITSVGVAEEGILCVKIIPAASFKGVLDNTTNDLFDLRSGDVVVGAEINVETTAGMACTIKVGYDAAAGGGIADSDGFIKAADANVSQSYNAKDPANTYRGKAMEYGHWASSAAGKVTVLSSADISGTGFVGDCIIYYLRNQ